MAYIRTKTINGNVYHYEQASQRINGKVVTKHIRYVGKQASDGTVQPLPESNVVPNSQPFILDPNSEISFQKYDLSQVKIIGKGSDRIVGELPNGDVIKIAITPRGLVQNQSEGDYLAPVPVVKDKGTDFVVVSKVEKNKETDKKIRKMLKPYEGFSQQDFDRKTSPLQAQFEKTDTEYGTAFTDLMSYDLLFGDFKRVSSWGMSNNEPILLDAGTLNNKIGQMRTQDQVFKEYNYTRDDWNTILRERQQTKNTILKKDTSLKS